MSDQLWAAIPFNHPFVNLFWELILCELRESAAERGKAWHLCHTVPPAQSSQQRAALYGLDQGLSGSKLIHLHGHKGMQQPNARPWRTAHSLPLVSGLEFT